MRQEFEVSVEELLRTLKRRGIPLPSEMGAFITLEVCEQIIDRPAHVSTQEVAINEIGEVLCTPRGEVSESESVRLLLLLLGDLLVCSAPGVPGMLLELVERGPSEATLDRLRDDLEASLLPLNRGATRRVLARLLREARKAGQTGRPSKQPNPADIDAQFDALLDSSADRARPRAVSQPAPLTAAARGAPLEPPGQTGSFFALEPIPTGQTGSFFGLNSSQQKALVSARAAGSAAINFKEPVSSLADELEPESPAARGGGVELRLDPVAPQPDPRGQKSGHARSVDLDGFVELDEKKASRAGLWMFGGCVVATLAALGFYFGLGGREGTRSALGLLPQPAAAAPTALPIAPLPKRQYGELRVNATLPKAQVLLGIGPGPALATDLPLGVAQEFVAIADGYAAARAIVPADAVWEEVDGKPRFELAIQADKLAPGAKAPLGATLLPRDVGTPQARLGAVRVVTTPKGAKVYQLVGFTPDVRVENLPLDQGYDVLVYLEGRAPVSRHLDPASFEERDGKRVADVEVTLSPAKGE